jgi:GH24 family phage-related lysozyme (muramidase)
MRWNQVLLSHARKNIQEAPTWGDRAAYVGGGGLGQALGAVNAMINDPNSEREFAAAQAAADAAAMNTTAGTDAGTDAAANSTATTTPTTGSTQSSGVTAADDLITMIKGFEGYGEKVNPAQGNASPVRPYWDVAQWSIGYGSYAGSRNRSRRPNIQWTPAQADQALRTQLVPYRRNVETINRRGRYNWSAEAKDALTSFAYNLGSINELTQNGTRSNREIAAKMLEYVNAGGQRLPGLVARRRIERQKFLNGIGQGRLDYTPGGAA